MSSTSVSQLQFESPKGTKTPIPHKAQQNKGKYQGNKSQGSKSTLNTYQHCGLSMKQENASEQTLSLQNFEFPKSKTKESKGVFKVFGKKDLTQKTRSTSNLELKERGYDFASSTNSHFDDWLFPVPPKFRRKCPSTSTEERQRVSTSSASTETPIARVESHDILKTSQEIINSLRKFSEKPKQFNGREWRKPCDESFVAGAPPKFIGTCKPNIEQIAKMSKIRQKLYLTQDPRKVHCLVNPEVLRSKGYSKKNEFDTLTKMVKHAKNTCARPASETSETFICEVIDLENPLQLDFQGLDYKNTYQKDEQDLLNERNYRRVCRFMDRQRVKAETKVKVEEEKHHEKLQIPPCFKIPDRIFTENPTPPEEPVKLAKLYRSRDKPINLHQIKLERERRELRYKNLYLKNRTRKQRKAEVTEQCQKKHEENIGLITADENFKQIITDVDTVVERSYKMETQPPRSMKESSSLHEGQKCKSYEHLKNNKLLSSDAGLETARSSFSNFITDNESENAILGKESNKFRLRSLQPKSSNNLKGRKKKQTATVQQGCMSRDQWLLELAPKKEKVKLDVEVGIQELRSPDDPKLVLFGSNVAYRPPKQELSEVKKFTLKPIGRHYDRVLRKTLKFVKPRLKYSVKKFNLVSYRFGDTAKRLSKIRDPLAEFERGPLKLMSTIDYIQSKMQKNKLLQEEMKNERLKLLGIPCKPAKKSRLQTKCENSSSSSDSEWVPEKESVLDTIDGKEFNKNLCEIMPLNRRTNMPAPKYREPTLRQHPRRPRDYGLQRVPSEMFDQIVLTSSLPHMYRLPPDVIQPANPSLKKRPYYQMFDARHHHDHWNPTQAKKVDVHYQPQLIKPKTTNVKHKSLRIEMEDFRKANPPCSQLVEMNVTMPKWNIDKIIHDYRGTKNKTGVFPKEHQMGSMKTSNLCQQQDYVLRSRDPQELHDLDYPGRQEYLKLLRDVEVSIQHSKLAEYPSEKLCINKAASLEGLEEELKSIESCLTSLSSSVCTNLTNDSGSLLLIDGKEKIPLDFIRKSLVPFEELQRSRFRSQPIDVDKEDANPFRSLPFSGQKKAQLELTTPKDKFFTFNSRLKNGLRLRLEVPVKDVGEQLIGKGSRKYKGVIATDVDENYVEVLNHRPTIKTFNFKTGDQFIKDAMRLKFESMLIQGQMVRTKIYNRLNEKHWTDMQRVKLLFEKLFVKWEKKEYDAAMTVVYKVKAFYDETDRLKNELKILDRKEVLLNMDIVFIEGHWIRCVMLQNFHYLLGDQEWRMEHDWIHRLPGEEGDDVQMENFEVSISKRSKINIRQREKDDAWAIKAFYEDVYLPNKHSNLIVFPNADSFIKGQENLKAKTFVLLLEMHFTLAIHTELQVKLETFIEWCAEDLRKKKDYVSRKCAKLYFMDDRAAWLKWRTLDYLGEPIKESFNDEQFLKDRGIIVEAWRCIVPANLRGGLIEQLEPVDMVAMMSDVVMELISKFESIPMEESLLVESKLRARRAYLRKQSSHACHVERRIEQEMKKVIRNLEPTPMKPKRPKKLPRYRLRKLIKPVEVHDKKISDRAKFFFQAFNEDGDMTQVADIHDTIAQVDTIQEQIVPFYFDYFLKLNGYTPNYNFKTQVELRDGPELERMQVRSVIPEIQERILQWETMKRKVMEDHIIRNPKMYIDVV